MEYVKDFDRWNQVKKFTEQRERPLFNEREIWWCLFGINVGSEQDGEGVQSLRPILIIKKINDRVLYCVPLTTKLRQDDAHVAFYYDDNLDTAILSQSKTIDARRLFQYKATIKKYTECKIKKALRAYLLA
jgi:mRNA-degrading endonuclease toxin of MazEF toxin-antitoxin module